MTTHAERTLIRYSQPITISGYRSQALLSISEISKIRFANALDLSMVMSTRCWSTRVALGRLDIVAEQTWVKSFIHLVTCMMC